MASVGGPEAHPMFTTRLKPTPRAFAFTKRAPSAAFSSVTSGLHGSGCPCCSPPSGATAWSKTPVKKNQLQRKPITYSADNTAGEAIECEAAVAYGVNDIKVTKVRVAPPRPGEVRVKVVANAICHTDLYVRIKSL